MTAPTELAQILEPILQDLKDLRERIRVLEERDNSRTVNRNRSSALNREMTTEDAMRVLNGDFKDLDHRASAEALGLTYSQIYSCRLGYTFKPVHRELEKAGWKPIWKQRK